MTMTSRICPFDIDGTLYNSHHEVLSSIYQELQQIQQGDMMMISLWRSLVQARLVINVLHLDSYILCNGTAPFVYEKWVQRTKDIAEYVTDTYD